MVELDKLLELIEPDTENAPVPDGLARERALRYFRDGVALDRDAIDEMRLGYYASIAHLDQEVGRVLQTLDEQGLTENTLVIFTSDHGDMLGDHHLTRKGAWFHDACSRVPLILRYPGVIEPETRVPHLVQLHDMAATILAAAGIEADKRQQWMPQSMDLIELIQSGQSSASYRDHAVTLYRNSGYGEGGTYFEPPIHCTMFRDEQYKLNVYDEPIGAGVQIQGELYDMQADPQETHNLWASERHRAIKERMLMRLVDWLVKTDATHQEDRWHS